MDKYFLTCPRGLEEVTKNQISNYINTSIIIDKGGVHFTGSLKDMYLINLHSRTGMRLLKNLFTFSINKPQDLYKSIYSLNWKKIIAIQKTFSIKTKLKTNLFTNSSATSLKIKDAIVDNIRKEFGKRPSIDKQNPDIGLFIFINDNNISIYLNTTGAPLFKRGYRTQIHKAALNESLAAGLVLLSNWNKKDNFYDIMCGSGTIPIEAAMIAYKIAPGLFRNNFAFKGFDDFNKTLWNKLINNAKENINLKDEIQIFGSDHIKDNIELSTNSSQKIGIENNIKFSISNINNIKVQDSSGTVIINPPYGNRIGDNSKIHSLYRNLGDIFKKKFSGYDAYIFSGNLDAIKSVGLRSKKRIILKNGTIDCRLVYYPMTTGNFS
jgi:putative N6-adenine-specific DNA methylase